MNRSKPIWGVGILGMMLGFALGWVVRPTDPEVSRTQPTKSARSAAPSPRTRSEDVNVNTWVAVLAPDELARMAQDVSLPDFQPLIEGLMAESWGQMAPKEVRRLEQLIGEWARQDLSGALAWARSQRHPQRRELGVRAIGVALSEEDPDAAFALFSEIGQITLPPVPPAMAGVLVEQVSRSRTAEEMAEVLKQIPLSPVFEEHGWKQARRLSLSLPKEFDYERLFDLMPELNLVGGDPQYLQVNYLQSWAMRDGDQVLDHIRERAAKGEYLDWSLALNQIETTKGVAETQQAAVELLLEFPIEGQVSLLSASGPQRLFELAHRIQDAEARTQLLEKLGEDERWDGYPPTDIYRQRFGGD